MVTRTMPVGRQIHRPAPRPVHKSAPPPASNVSQILIGALIGVGVFVGLAIIYVYGTAGLVPQNVPRRGDAPPPAAATVPDRTTLYRTMRDGRVMVMEVDRNGTRVVGTMSKDDVPLANDPSRNNQRAHNLDATERLNAFSDTFK